MKISKPWQDAIAGAAFAIIFILIAVGMLTCQPTR